MNILVSNDDGIAASGINILARTLAKTHNVYVVAPDRERSASGHSLTLHTPLRVEELEETKTGAKRTWITTGTPGDCIKIAVNAILSKDEQPDIIISGINHGPNLGADILYSGTVSCAMEGAMLGIPSIAVSLATMEAEYEDFIFPAQFINKFLNKIKNFKFPKKTILNVNIPKLAKEDISGIAITELGGRMFTDDYEKRIDPRGKTYYWMAGELINNLEGDNTDIVAVRSNKISITPITYEMTRKETVTSLNDMACSQNFCNWIEEK